MSRTRPNILLISSDQHNPHMTGYAGHPLARTPALDGLAERGTVYRSAYCSSPICVPSRASLATGRYVHEIGAWDNAAPYAGTPRSWGHELSDAGYRVVTIGKLHHLAGSDDGFSDQRLPMHVHGLGDLRGVSMRPHGGPLPTGQGLRNLLNAGVGDSDYTRYDREVADQAVAFLRETNEPPWALMVSFVSPHFPLIAPQPYHDLYRDVRIPPPPDGGSAWSHPAVEVFRQAFGLSRSLTGEETQAALRAYLGLCSYLDAQVGRVLEALDASGQAQDTLVVYTSDHGESAGEHGLWFKHLMNEASVGVPLVIAGSDVPSGHEVAAPVSQVDLFATLMAWTGVTPIDDRPRPGISLLDPDSLPTDRAVLAEYHANGSLAASFMLRHGSLKYIEYVGERPQLFDLKADPGEFVDLAPRAEHADALATCAAQLREFCDPAEVDAAAKSDQARRVERVGGIEAAARHTVAYTPVPSVPDGGNA